MLVAKRSSGPRRHRTRRRCGAPTDAGRSRSRSAATSGGFADRFLAPRRSTDSAPTASVRDDRNPLRVNALASSSAMPRSEFAVLGAGVDRGPARCSADPGLRRTPTASTPACRPTPPAASASATASRHSGGDTRRKNVRDAERRSGARRPSPWCRAIPAAVRGARSRT